MDLLSSIFNNPPPGTPHLPGTLPFTRPHSPDKPLLSSPRSTLRVAVLVDGNTDTFTASSVTKGARGGRAAALDLRNKVHALVVQRERETSAAGLGFRPPEVLVLAKVFLNVRKGIEGADMEAFAQGFNSSPLAFSMVDVGPQRDAVDEAIKGHLPFLLSSCDLILLGSSLDGGYASELVRLDPTTQQEKLLLLRTGQAVAERLSEVGLEEVSLPGLFGGAEAVQLETQHPSPFFPSTPSPLLSRISSPAPHRASPFGAPGDTSSSSSFGLERTASGSYSPFAPSAMTAALFPSLATPAPIGTPPGAGAGGLPSAAMLPPPLAAPPVPAAEPAPPASPVRPPAPAAAPSPPPPAPASPSKPALSVPCSPSRTAIARAAPPSPSKATAPAPAPDFRPLLSLLSHFCSAGQPRPRRADVGQRLRRAHPSLYSSFGEYAAEAERRGLVTLGKGEKSGGEWIARRGAEGAEQGVSGKGKGREGTEELGGLMGGLSLANGAKAKAPPPPPPATPPPAPEPPYAPLLTLLLSQLSQSPPRPRPLRSLIGENLRRMNAERGPGRWLFDAASREGLREYFKGAEKEGLVRTGAGEGVGKDWIELVDPEAAKAILAGPPSPAPVAASPARSEKMATNGHARQASETSAMTSEEESDASSTPAAYTPYLPLLSLLLSQLAQSPPRTRPLRSFIGEQLRRLNHQREAGDKLFDSSTKEGLREYFRKAQEEGWVQMGTGEGVGTEWVELVAPETARALLHTLPLAPRAPVPPQTPNNPPATSSSSPFSLPTKFHPLVRTLRASPLPAPHWTTVGSTLNRARPRVYDEGGFKAYVREAEREGVIKTGEVEGKEGCFWMRLTPAAQTFSLPSPPASAPAPPASPPEILPRYVRLITAIRHSEYARPHWTTIGLTLNRVRPRLYEEGGFKAFVLEAERLGIIETGEVKGKEQCWWMRLTPAMDSWEEPLFLPDYSPPPSTAPSRSSTPATDRQTSRQRRPAASTQPSSSTAAPVAAPSTVPARFLPLLRAILAQPFPRPFYSQVGIALNRLRPRPYGESAGAEYASMKEYVEDAVRLGVVERGKGAQSGQDWIIVRPDLVLPDDLDSPAQPSPEPAEPSGAPAPPVSSLSLFPPLPGSTTSTSPVPSRSPLPDFSRPPVITTPSGHSSGMLTVPEPLLLRWRGLAATHPFAPLILSLRYLQDHDSSSSSLSSGGPAAPSSLARLQSILAQFPTEALPAVDEATGAGLGPLERLYRHGGAGEGDGFFGYLGRAQREGIVEVGEEGVRLREGVLDRVERG
ncbi:hypothetical protein JCM10207_008505 [Rhodosporidiobolus poonsookiae]